MLITGLDLGTATDPTALSCLDKSEAPRPHAPRPGDKPPKGTFLCRHLERFPLGLSYVAIVERVVKLFDTAPLADSTLVIDYTGVGRPIYDQIKAAKPKAKLVPVLITAGANVSCVNGVYHVAKVVLASTTQVLMQERRLKVANVPEREVLVHELENFEVKVTKSLNETFAARTGEHDDLTLATMIAAWWGERPLRQLWVST